jgi:hypothetical protein
MNEIDLIKEIKSAWGWCEASPVKILYMNDFANIIFLNSDNSYWLLRPEELLCEEIATSENELNSLWKNEDFVLDWEMQNLVDVAEKNLGEKPQDYSFHFVIPPVLGGAFDIENIKAVPSLEVISFTGHIAEQIKDLPEGAQVELKITD